MTGLRRLAGSILLRTSARVGLVARAVFYLLLAGLALSLITGPPGREGSANANGALRAVAQTGFGRVLLLGAAVGFASYGLARVIGALTDAGPGRLRRLSTAGQGFVYFGFAWVTASFLRGQRSAGSEQQRERTTGLVLGLPAGRLLVAAAGLALLAVCLWQLRVATKGHFGDTLDEDQMSPGVHAVVWLIARVGIAARAVAFAPVGLFLFLAGARSSPEQADGLDALLLSLTGTGWGALLVALTAGGFLVFAAYSLLEARYRQVSTGA